MASLVTPEEGSGSLLMSLSPSSLSSLSSSLSPPPSSSSSSLSPPPPPSSSSSPPPSRSLSPSLVRGVAGLGASIAVTAAFQPLDCIKTRAQVLGHFASVGVVSPSSSAASSSFFLVDEARRVATVARTTFVDEGAAAFWRGSSAALVASSVSWSVFMATRDAFRRANAATVPTLRDSDVLLSLVSSFEAGIVMAVVCNPLWVIKNRMQVDSMRVVANATTATRKAPRVRRYSGVVDGARSIVRDEGVRGLYRGMAPACLLVCNGALQFAVYDTLRAGIARAHHDDDDNSDAAASASSSSSSLSSLSSSSSSTLPTLSPAANFACGALSKLVATVATFPASVLKTRMQLDQAFFVGHRRFNAQPSSSPRTSSSPSSTPPPLSSPSSSSLTSSPYTRLRSAARHVLVHEGVRGFYSGLLPSLARQVPYSATTLAVYEWLVERLSSVPE